MTLEQIRLVHGALAANDWVMAAQLILVANEIEAPVSRLAKARDMKESAFAQWQVRTLYNNLVLSGDHLGASALVWSKDLFYQEPESVGRVFKAMHEQDMLLCMGASSMTKSYSVIAWEVLDWLLDPFYTSIKLTSQTEGHLKTNVWPHMIDMVKASVIQPVQEWTVKEADLWLGIKNTSMFYGFSGIAFKQSQISAGAFKGYKSQPKRPKDDPLYGAFGVGTRLRVTIDEAQQVPEGTWTDLNSIMGSMDTNGHVKINAAFNPEDLSQAAVQRAEPEDGWSMDQLEKLYSYRSKQGWWVERLDAARCENVMQRKTIYPRLMTYQSYLKYLSGGGDNSSKYFTFARGFPPLKDSANTVIPPEWVHTQRGEAIYTGKVDHYAAFDLAFQGQDKAMMAVGRWGLASGWKPNTGPTVWFEDRLRPGKKKERHVLTIDQLLIRPKSADATVVQADMMGQCKIMGIPPENVAMDQTGNSYPVYSHVSKYWGNVLGIGWGEGATETLVVAGDKAKASELYEGIPSELWFSFKRWLDPTVCAILINPLIPTTPLNRQFTSRRFRYVKNHRMRIESKDEYKARNGGVSPDDADCTVMLAFIVRQRGGVLPGIIEQIDRSSNQNHGEPIKMPDNYNNNEPMDNGTVDGPKPMEIW